MVRVRLDVTDAQAGMLLRAAGARRFAWNWAVGKITANAEQWAAEASYDIPKPDRVRPLSFFTLGKLWTAEKPTVCPWAGEHSTWTFRYALRDAANAHAAFLAGKRRFPKFKSRRRDRPRFTVTDGLALEAGRLRVAKYGWLRIAAACPAQAKLRRLLRRGPSAPVACHRHPAFGRTLVRHADLRTGNPDAHRVAYRTGGTGGRGGPWSEDRSSRRPRERLGRG